LKSQSEYRPRLTGGTQDVGVEGDAVLDGGILLDLWKIPSPPQYPERPDRETAKGCG